MRCFFRRDLLIKVEEGYLIVANRTEELAVISHKEIFEFVHHLKSALASPPFKIRLCSDCFLTDTTFIFQNLEVKLSDLDLFNFLSAVSANLNFTLMSDVQSVSDLVQLKEFSLYLVTKSVKPDQAEICLQSLKAGRICPLLLQYVSKNLTNLTEKNQEVQKFFLYHHRMIKCYFDLHQLLKK